MKYKFFLSFCVFFFLTGNIKAQTKDSCLNRTYVYGSVSKMTRAEFLCIDSILAKNSNDKILNCTIVYSCPEKILFWRSFNLGKIPNELKIFFQENKVCTVTIDEVREYQSGRRLPPVAIDIID